MVQAYLTVWRSTGGVNKEAPKQVDDKLHQELEEIVYPWPEIKADPTPERSDGRFAKAFPLTFPTGSGDLYHARLRSDFSTADWAQHVFRYTTSLFLFEGTSWRQQHRNKANALCLLCFVRELGYAATLQHSSKQLVELGQK